MKQTMIATDPGFMNTRAKWSSAWRSFNNTSFTRSWQHSHECSSV